MWKHFRNSAGPKRFRFGTLADQYGPPADGADEVIRSGVEHLPYMVNAVTWWVGLLMQGGAVWVGL